MSVIQSTQIANRGLINSFIAGTTGGCSNVTSILSQMCQARTASASTATYSGCTWCPQELGQICNFIAEASGDQCASTYGQAGGGRVSPDFENKCVVGRTYAFESLLPGYCNCSSQEFTRLVEGTWTCTFANRFNRLFLQDGDPLTVMRNFNSSRDGNKFDYGFFSGFVPDDWAKMVSWRIPVIAPATLQVGSLSGALRDNGWLGTYNQSYDGSADTKAAIDNATSVTGLLRYFPTGKAYTDPSTVGGPNAAYQPSTYDTVQWATKRPCLADKNLTTCCFDAVRDTTTNPYPSCPISSVGCADEDAMDISTTLCKPCYEYENNPDKATNVWKEETKFEEGSGRNSQENTRDVVYDIVPGSLTTYCHGRRCMASVCEVDASSGLLRNPKCNGVKPAMDARCANMTDEIVLACQAGGKWEHPFSVSLAMLKWATWRGCAGGNSNTSVADCNAVFAPNVDVSVTADLAAAFLHATLTAANAGAGLWVPSQSCVRPFCYDFRASPSPQSEGLNAISAAAKCAASTPEMSAVLSSLNLVYPCSASGKGADLSHWTEGGVPYSSQTAYSTAERKMCTEAYGLMGTVYTVGPGYGDFSVVPECSPVGLDMHEGFHTSCGVCEPATCPVFEHFTVPLYSDEPSLLEITKGVLANQQAILCRETEGGNQGTCPALPSPTLPLNDVPSNELDKLYPSTALQFNTLDLTSLQVAFRPTIPAPKLLSVRLYHCFLAE